MQEDDEEPQQTADEGEWPTERVRIVGAEPAAVLAERPTEPAEPTVADSPDREQHYLGFVHQQSPPPPPLPPPPLESTELAANAPELLHWSDPPTGQVPAVIDRRTDDDDDAFGDSGPVWREHEHEWDSGSFEPAMLADDQTPLGALDEGPFEERRPWDFDDLVPAEEEPPGEEEAVEPDVADTESVDVAGRSGEPTGGRRTRRWGRRPTDFLSEQEDPFSPNETAEHRLFAAHQPDVGPENGASSFWDEGPEATGIWADWNGETDAGTAADARPDAGNARLGAGPGDGGPSAFTVIDPPSGSPVRIVSSATVAAAGGTATTERAALRAPSPGRPGGVGRPGRGDDKTGAGGRNVPAAVATGVVAVAVVLGCLALGPLASVALATAAMTLAAAETYASFRRAGMHPATLLGLVATVGVMVAAYNKGIAALPLVAALLLITAMIWYLVGADRGAPVVGISSTVLGFAWVGILGSFVALMLAPSIYPHRHGVAFTLGAVVATAAADVGALAVGSWLGRHQLAPHVSPNKTWEGWLGGAVLAVLASVFITGHVHPWTPLKAGILGIVVAIVAPLGDLCESLVKRDLGLKDMGSLLPGHGGVLDRVDALLFVMPATYYLVRVLHLG